MSNYFFTRKKAVIKGKRACMFHGGKSTGSVTSLGKQKSAKAKTIHGRETILIREKRSQKFADMKNCFNLISHLGS
ncbi:hypothetical protein OA340_01300 [Paracoccaceae bacterium]|nr:hypothetical protein [Paracoccaceae bacterium]